MDMLTLCQQIGLPEEVTRKILALDKTLAETPLTRAILDPAGAWDAYKGLEEICHREDLGFSMLTYQLRAARLTYDRYLGKGISPSVFTATMDCFPRFIGEHRASFGVYGFDRGWWTWRQLSMTLFCLRTLEYEFRDDRQRIYLHIPSGTDLSLPACRASLGAMERFVQEYYPEKQGYRYCVDSWLLSPVLEELLDADSRILGFQRAFTREEVCREGNGCLTWVYGSGDIPYEDLPEHTTLQRNMKQYLLRGGQIGSAWGFLKDGFRQET